MRYIVKLDMAAQDTYEFGPEERADAEERALEMFCADYMAEGLGAEFGTAVSRRAYRSCVGYGPDYTDYFEEIEYGADVTVEARAAAAFVVEARDPDLACERALEAFEELFPDADGFGLVSDTVIAVE